LVHAAASPRAPRWAAGAGGGRGRRARAAGAGGAKRHANFFADLSIRASRARI